MRLLTSPAKGLTGNLDSTENGREKHASIDEFSGGIKIKICTWSGCR